MQITLVVVVIVVILLWRLILLVVVVIKIMLYLRSWLLLEKKIDVSVRIGSVKKRDVSIRDICIGLARAKVGTRSNRPHVRRVVGSCGIFLWMLLGFLR